MCIRDRKQPSKALDFAAAYIEMPRLKICLLYTSRIRSHGRTHFCDVVQRYFLSVTGIYHQVAYLLHFVAKIITYTSRPSALRMNNLRFCHTKQKKQ